MKSSIEKLSSLERKLNIEVPATEVQAAFDRAFRSIQREAAIKGFRKGKAPIATVRSVFGERVRQDVVQNLIQSSYSAALNEHDLDPISYPTIEFDPLENEEKDFAFTAEFEIRPEVKQVSYDRLAVKKEKADLSDARADAAIEDLRRSRSQTIPVFEDRAAQKGDVAVVDFEGSLLMGPLEGGSAQGHELELGSGSFIAGFEEGIEGMRIGQEKTLQLAFPDEYHAKDIAGKPVTFKVKLTGLKKKELPELNDEFAKGLGPYANMQEVRDAILKNMNERENERIDEDLRNRAMKALVDRNPVDVPKTLHAEQKKLLIEDLRKRTQQQGLDEKTFEEYKARWDDDFSQTANYMIRASFLVDAIAEEHGLRATESEIEAKLRDYAAETGLGIDQIREFYKAPERRSRVAYQITERKALDQVLAKADIREVSKHEIEADNAATGRQ